MITDIETNFVYFSRLLTNIEQYKPFWERLEPELKKIGISYGFIDGTRDIWCRDYMPVQVSEKEFCQFQFFPDYYLNPKSIHKLTISHEVCVDYNFHKKDSPIILDGGNIVKSKNKVIISEKILGDNKYRSKDTMIKNIKRLLNIEDVILIPRLPYDETGHADGMVRFINDHKLIYSDFISQSASWQRQFYKAIDDIEIESEPFPYFETGEKNKDGGYTAKGCYINFAQIGTTILLPQFGCEKKDKEAIEKAVNNFPSNFTIVPIEANEIAEDGGVLNCVTWNIKK